MSNELRLDHNGHVVEHMPEPDVVQAVIPAHGAPEPAKPPDLTESSDGQE